MKTKPFPIRRPKEEQVSADYGKDQVWRPGRSPGRYPIAFTEGQEKMGQEIH